MKKLLYLFICIFLISQCVYAETLDGQADPVKNKGYTYSNMSTIKSGQGYVWLQWSDGSWYVVDTDQLDDNEETKLQQLNSSNVYITDQFVKQSNNYYYIGPDGKMIANGNNIKNYNGLSSDASGVLQYGGKKVKSSTDIGAEVETEESTEAESEEVEESKEVEESEEVEEFEDSEDNESNNRSNNVQIDVDRSAANNTSWNWYEETTGNWKYGDGTHYIASKWAYLNDGSGNMMYYEFGPDGICLNPSGQSEDPSARNNQQSNNQPTAQQEFTDTSNFTSNSDQNNPLVKTELKKDSTAIDTCPVRFKDTSEPGLSFKTCELLIGSTTFTKLEYDLEGDFIKLPENICQVIKACGFNIYNGSTGKFNIIKSDDIKLDSNKVTSIYYYVNSQSNEEYIVPIMWLDLNGEHITIDCNSNAKVNGQLLTEYFGMKKTRADYTTLTSIDIGEQYEQSVHLGIQNESYIIRAGSPPESFDVSTLNDSSNYNVYTINGVAFIKGNTTSKVDTTIDNVDYQVKELKLDDKDFREYNVTLGDFIKLLFMIVIPMILITFGILEITVAMSLETGIVRLVCAKYFDLIRVLTIGNFDYQTATRKKLFLFGIKMICFGFVIMVFPYLIRIIVRILDYLAFIKGE